MQMNNLCSKIVDQDLALEEWCDEHSTNTVRWLNDPVIMRDFGITFHISKTEHEIWRNSQKSLLAWAIVKAGIHVGDILVFENKHQRSGYFQIYIGDPECRGQGVAKKAVSMILRHIFIVLKFNRIWLHTYPENLVAERLYKSFNFKQEGCERSAVKDVDGRFKDQLRWALLADDYIHSMKNCMSATRVF